MGHALEQAIGRSWAGARGLVVAGLKLCQTANGAPVAVGGGCGIAAALGGRQEVAKARRVQIRAGGRAVFLGAEEVGEKGGCLIGALVQLG